MSNKIFWGFDAFESDLRTNTLVGETLASLNEKLKAEIYPIFTFGSVTGDSIPPFESDTIAAVAKVAEEKMQSVLDKIKIPGVLLPKVIIDHSFSRTKVVKNFIDYAEKNGASLIAIGSHGKKGLERIALGSFAETLLLQCHLPVLVVGQNFDQTPKWGEILFPTDFSDDSHFAFYKALELAKVLSAKVVLFHHLSPIISPLIQSAMAPFGGVWLSSQEEMENLKKQKTKMLEEWVAAAKTSQIEVKSFLDDSVTDSSEAILSYASSNNIGLIAMAAQSGPMATTFFGAITRKVVRQSECPVWLLRRH